MTSWRVEVDDYGNQKSHRLVLPPPGTETNSWYVEIPGMVAWLERMKDAYRWCARCLVVRRTEDHEAHRIIHSPDYLAVLEAAHNKEARVADG